MNLKQARNRAAALTASLRKIADAAGDQPLSEDQQKEYSALESQLGAVKVEIKREEDLLQAEKDLLATRDRHEEPEKPQKSAFPDTYRRHGKLDTRAYATEKDAYIAGQFALATLFGNEKAGQWCKDGGYLLKVGDPGWESLAQGTNSNTAGGYLVVPQFLNAIVDLREEYGVFRPNTRVVTMVSDTMSAPRRTSGLTAYFVSENPASGITESNKTWDSISLTAKKLAAIVKYSSEIAEDAVISIAQDLASEIAYAFAVKEDNCGFIGDGTSTYGGMEGAAVKINNGSYAGSIHTALSGNTGFATLDLEDFNGAVGKLPMYALRNAKWYISSVGFANSMQRLAYAAGGNTVSMIAGGTGYSFLGFPVVISQVLNSTTGADTSAIKLLFGDLSLASTMGDRRSIEIATSTERYFETDQLAIRGTSRFDINVHDLGGSSSAGPLVALKTPGS